MDICYQTPYMKINISQYSLKLCVHLNNNINKDDYILKQNFHANDSVIENIP